MSKILFELTNWTSRVQRTSLSRKSSFLDQSFQRYLPMEFILLTNLFVAVLLTTVLIVTILLVAVFMLWLCLLLLFHSMLLFCLLFRSMLMSRLLWSHQVLFVWLYYFLCIFVSCNCMECLYLELVLVWGPRVLSLLWVLFPYESFAYHPVHIDDIVRILLMATMILWVIYFCCIKSLHILYSTRTCTVIFLSFFVRVVWIRATCLGDGLRPGNIKF